MTSSGLSKINQTGLAKDFRSTVVALENNLKSIANGIDIVAGTEENPIVSDSKLIPIRHFFMDGVYIRR